jgi:hypothetical protein
MRTTLRTLLATAALLAPALAHTAFAAEPRLVNGEDGQVTLQAPTRGQNIVGGGVLRATPDGEGLAIAYTGAAPAQRAPEGRLPIAVSNGETLEVLWIQARRG